MKLLRVMSVSLLAAATSFLALASARANQARALPLKSRELAMRMAEPVTGCQCLFGALRAPRTAIRLAPASDNESKILVRSRIAVQAPSDGLPDAPGKAVVIRMCTLCHGTDLIVDTPRTVPVWNDTLDLMKGLGAEGSDENWKTVAGYLTTHLAHLEVNKATAGEIALVFGVTEKIAEGVVAYRDKQGGFKTIDDLKKAPDLDAAKVDALKARLIFPAA